MASRFEQIVALVEAQMASTSVPKKVGGRYLKTTFAPPLVVWTPGPLLAPWTGPDRLGGAEVSVWTRNVAFQAHVFGSTIEQTEDLLHDVGRAMHEALHGSIGSVREQWPDPRDLAWSTRGEYVLLTFDVEVPITTTPYAVATVTDIVLDPAGAAAGDGVLQAAGEP
jgi:hypothetical protein